MSAMASTAQGSARSPERGSGYRSGLREDAIPLSARIVAIADAPQCMTRDRPYRKAWPLGEALEVLREGAGKQFDRRPTRAPSSSLDKRGHISETVAVGARDAYLTTDEAATTLRVSERTVRRWVARGALPARKFGGTVRIPRVALTAASLAAARPRRGRPPRTAGPELSALSHDVFRRTWNNPADAVYDRWREIYGVRQG